MQSGSETCTFIQDVIKKHRTDSRTGTSMRLPTSKTHNAHIPFTCNNQVNIGEQILLKKHHTHALLQHCHSQAKSQLLLLAERRIWTHGNSLSVLAPYTFTQPSYTRSNPINNSGICRNHYLSHILSKSPLFDKV
jgi:hypothetical protein